MDHCSLLRRQISKYLGRDFEPTEELDAFLKAVNEAYIGFDEDQELMERSLTISSQELNESNKRLREEVELARKVIDRLRSLTTKISSDIGATTINSDKEQDLLEVVEILSIAFQQNTISQDRLLRAKERADLIYRVIPSAIFTTDTKKRITSWNKKAEEITGFTQEEVVGKPCNLLSGKNGCQKCSIQHSKAVTGERCSIITKHGEERIISKNIEVLYDPEGNVIGGIESFEDITQQEKDRQELKEYDEHLEELVWERTNDLLEANKQLKDQIQIREEVENQLRTSQEKYQLLAENLQETIFRLSPEGHVQYMSRTVHMLTGYNPDEVEGSAIEVLFDKPEEYAEVQRVMQSIIIRKLPESFVFCLRHKDGNVSYTEATAAPLIQNDEVVAIQGALRDVTERHQQETDLKKAKNTAEKANRAKSSFLSTISHEIRTPLHGIIGFAELIKTLAPAEGIMKLVDMILSESSHLTTLINSLLDHAKIEAGKLDLMLKPFDLYSLLGELELLMNNMARPGRLDIEVRIDQDVPQWILADDMRIKQVLINITSNAIKFTHEGSVRLEVSQLEQYGRLCALAFTVKDTGIGIPADKVDTVFESFTQVDSRISRVYGGTGLGTTITRQLVELMGGTVSLESTEGVGTMFQVKIPVQIVSEETHSEIETVARHTTPGAPRLPDSRILVAEDNENGQMLIRMNLESTGCKVDVAGNGKEAIQLYEQHQYDLVITDIQMPEMNGYSLAEAIRTSETPESSVPIIAMTANADTATRNKCMKSGMDDVLTKPLRRRILIETVSRWVNRPADAVHFAANNQQIEAISEKNPAAMRDDGVFSYKTALDEFCGKKNLLNQALKQYIQSSERQFKLMNEACDNKDSDTVRKIAHQLRGASANLTATRLQAVAEKIETGLLDGKPLSDVSENFQEWEDNWNLLMERLRSDPSCKGIIKQEV